MALAAVRPWKQKRFPTPNTGSSVPKWAMTSAVSNSTYNSKRPLKNRRRSQLQSRLRNRHRSQLLNRRRSQLLNRRTSLRRSQPRNPPRSQLRSLRRSQQKTLRLSQHLSRTERLTSVCSAMRTWTTSTRATRKRSTTVTSTWLMSRANGTR